MISLFDIENYRPDHFQKLIDLYGANHSGCIGRTPIFYACQLRRDDVVTALINKGADVNIQDEFGRTALHIACLQYNNEKIIRILLSLSDLSLKDKDNNTAEDVCIKVNYLEIFNEFKRATP